MRIAVFFVGTLHDRGFNAGALVGARAAAERRLADIRIVEGVPYDQEAIGAELRRLMPACDGVVFVGGQGNLTVPVIAREFPDKRFAIVQGERTGTNLASYEVRQEDSAFLAGYLAARLTRTGILAHLSGHRVAPGLKGRAAFVAGARLADPEVGLLTAFCGTQDDDAVTREWAAAQIAAGADILFTMLNGARGGAIEACETGGARQIGNVLDWCAERPDVFVASATARIDLAVERAIADMATGAPPPLEVVRFGLAQGPFASLVMGGDVSESVRKEIAAVAEALAAGDIEIPHHYAGPEFAPPNSPSR